MSKHQDCSVIDLASEEARLFQHANLGSEHLLLAAIRTSSIAASFLKRRRIDIQDIRKAIQELMGGQQLNLSAMAKRIVEVSSSSELTSFPEPERVLIAICRTGDGVGPRILTNFKISLRILESEILQGLGVPKQEALAVARQSLINRLQASIQKLDSTIEYAQKINDADYLEQQKKDRRAVEVELNAVIAES